MYRVTALRYLVMRVSAADYLANSADSYHIALLKKSGPEVIKRFSCSIKLSMKFFMLIHLKLLTIAISFLLNIAESWHFHIY